MKRAYAQRHDSHKPEPTQPAVPTGATGREIELSLDRDELLGLMQDSLESLALKLGMLVASSLLEDEVTRLCGRRHERQPRRTHTRYGHQRGTATLAHVWGDTWYSLQGKDLRREPLGDTTFWDS